MPLVTDKGLDSFLKIVIWRGVFAFGSASAFTSILLSPIWLTAPKTNYFMPLWTLTALIIAGFGAWRWRHWQKIQKANIFNDDMTPYRKIKQLQPTPSGEASGSESSNKSR